MQNPRDITFSVTNRGLVQFTLSRNIWSVSYSVPTETSGVAVLSRLIFWRLMCGANECLFTPVSYTHLTLPTIYSV